ncbi:MAG: sterol desaturase family protein [Pseudomonadota bacterium]
MTDISIPGIALATLGHDLFRYLIGAGGVWLIINIWLARPLALRKIRGESPPSSQMVREFMTSMRTVLIFATVGTGITAAAIVGCIPVYRDIDLYGWRWLFASALLIVIAHDAFFYWAHWIMHRPRFFRWFHQTHHRSHNPTPFASYSFDTGEVLVMALFLPVFLPIFPTHPVVILFFTIHMMLRNALGHCGYEIYPAARNGKPLFDWMTTTTHHDLHHAHAGCNFGLYFTWWDRLMGTEHPRYHSEFARVSGTAVSERSQS